MAIYNGRLGAGFVAWNERDCGGKARVQRMATGIEGDGRLGAEFVERMEC